MFKKPIVWVILVLISVGSGIFSFKYFSDAFPIVTLDIKMDRQAALRKGRELAQRRNWGPEGFRQAASFGVDRKVQNFVELEAGGNEAFRRMLKEGLYSPYTWRVRNFKEGETNEALVRFTAEGGPYGFSEKLPEDEAGASLEPNAARVIAETSSKEEWQIELSVYELVEQSQEVRPGGRIDHSFVYERPDVQIGEGHYRLRLVVGGDKLTELTHFVKVPEAFERRYGEMRSANKTIARAAGVAMSVLYVLGGCVIGLFLLLGRHWVIWRKPLLWGLFVALVQVLAGINYLPLAWMGYDTALSAQGFLLRQIMQLLLNFVGLGIFFTVSFMAAESLTRKAFGGHIQMWRLWSSDVAGSVAVLGRTISGYLLVSVFFAFVIAFYFFTTKVLGWWIPSGTLFHPDMLATYFPWLTSVAISLQAGFMEECMFRAIPIAGAALLGQRFGRRRVWIIGAFIIQALIFSGAHASYPNQPAYARLVELFIPSLVWGAIYLYFGLLPVIVLHFAIDVVAISLPLFVASTPGIWVERAMVIVLTLVPLWVIVWSRLRSRGWSTLKEEHFNRSWQPTIKEELEPVTVQIQERPEIGPQTRRWVLVGGILGLVLWLFFAKFQNDAPSLTIGRGEVEKLAQKTLAARDIELSDSWQILCDVRTPSGQDDRFIWQKGGKENYDGLMGTYLRPPYWRVRFVQFEGDVAERAEEYQVSIAKEGEVFRFRHNLPEGRAGVSLTEEQARQIAHSALRENYQLEPLELKEISAGPSKLPERKDWQLTFEDTLNYPLEEGQARIAIKIAGNEMVDSSRYVHVPEEWGRQDRNKRNLTKIVQNLSGLIIFIMFFAGTIGAIISWSRKNFSVQTFLQFFVLVFGLGAIGYINSWPDTIAGFSTTEPLSNQIFTAITSSALRLLFLSAGMSLVAGFVQSWKAQQPQNPKTGTVWLGFSLGVLVAGIWTAISALFEPSLGPFWAKYSALGNYLPVLGAAVSPVLDYIGRTILFLLVFTAVDRFTRGWEQRKTLFSIVLILSMLVSKTFSANGLPFWLLSGLLTGIIYLLIYKFVFRLQLALIPLALGSIAILDNLKEGILNAHPAAIGGAALSIILIVLVSIYWYKKLLRRV